MFNFPIVLGVIVDWTIYPLVSVSMVGLETDHLQILRHDLYLVSTQFTGINSEEKEKMKRMQTFGLTFLPHLTLEITGLEGWL